jgi:type IV pilus assembly protein PilA
MTVFRKLRNESGQGMTEYIIIVALIAIAAIAAFTYFGSTVRNQTAAMTEELAGQSGKAETEAAGKAADNAASDAATTKTLKNYADSADKTK